jgi:hypothetical protein
MTQPFPFTYKRAEIPVGIPAGNLMYAPLEQGNLPTYVPAIDFTTITTVYWKVTRQKDTTTATWTTTVFSTVTTNGLVAIYTFAGVPPAPSTDAYIDGVYFLRPYVVTPSLTIPFDVQPLYVVIP